MTTLYSAINARKYQSYFQEKRQARLRGDEFTLTQDEYWDIVVRQCHYCGKEPDSTFRVVCGDDFYETQKHSIASLGSDGSLTRESAVSCCAACKSSRKRRGQLGGQRFGKLTAISYEPVVAKSGVRQPAWRCICDCGNEKVVRVSHLSTCAVRSCGCLDMERKYAQFEDETPWRQVYSNYVRRAKKKNIALTIAYDEFRKLITQNCYYCGAEPSGYYEKKYRSRKDGRAHQTIRYNGLDRVDNSKGYELDNVVPCCKHCNTMKGALSVEEFRSWVMRVSAYLAAEQPPTDSTLITQFVRQWHENSDLNSTKAHVGRRDPFTAFRNLYYNYTYNATKRSIDFLLSHDEFLVLTKQNCHYCGAEPAMINTVKNKGQSYVGEYIYNGVDRLDSSGGYIPINCVAACRQCNSAKNSMSYTIFIEHIGSIVRQGYLR